MEETTATDATTTDATTTDATATDATAIDATATDATALEEIVNKNCLKKKMLIKAYLECYRNSHYPLYIYQVLYNGQLKHISSREKDVTLFDLSTRDNYHQTTIPDTTGKVCVCSIFSIEAFVDDITDCSSIFIFPSIDTKHYLDNLNMYHLCLDYKTTRDMIRYIKSINS